MLPADFDAALAELGGVGANVSQAISADDATDREVDLESRIATSAASMLRLRDLLDDAGDVNIIASSARCRTRWGWPRSPSRSWSRPPSCPPPA